MNVGQSKLSSQIEVDVLNIWHQIDSIDLDSGCAFAVSADVNHCWEPFILKNIEKPSDLESIRCDPQIWDNNLWDMLDMLTYLTENDQCRHI